MALIEFECGTCGRRFEELVRDGVEVVCPECGAGKPTRIWSPVGGVGAARMSRSAMRDSDARRSERESRRKEEFSARRKRRAAGSS